MGLLDYFWRYGYEDFFILNRGDEVINDYTMGWIRTVMYPSNFLYRLNKKVSNYFNFFDCGVQNVPARTYV